MEINYWFKLIKYDKFLRHKPTQMIQGHVMKQNHQILYAPVSAAARLLFGGKWCFSTVTAIYIQELEVWGICKAITTGSDPCPCLQFPKQGGEEYIVQQMSQNNPLRNKCAKSLYSTTREIGEEGMRMQGSQFIMYS